MRVLGRRLVTPLLDWYTAPISLYYFYIFSTVHNALTDSTHALTYSTHALTGSSRCSYTSDYRRIAACCTVFRASRPRMRSGTTVLPVS